MQGICLELVRGYDGNLVEVHAVDPSTIRKSYPEPGWVQVIDGKPVQYFSSTNLLFFPVGELP